MATKKYVSFDKLSLYDEKIKGVISASDAATLESAKGYADGLASNYDAAGSASSAQAAAKTYTDGQISTVNGTVAGVKTIAEQGVADAAAAKSAADAAQGEVDVLKTYVGTFTHDTAKSVVEYINAKTDGIATSGNLEALGTRVTTVEGKVATIEGDYLKSSDKTALEGQISGVQTAVDTEKSRAEGIEAGLRTDVDKILGDYLKAADKTELQGNIDTVAGAVERLTNGVSADEVDGVNDLIQYVKDHGTEVTGMQGDIADNAAAIEGVAERVGTLEGEMDNVQEAVAGKVEQSVYDAKIAELAGADSTMSGKISALESAIGESGSVAEDIATAKQEAIDAAAGDATTKAGNAEKNAKDYADGLNTTMNGRVEALEAVDHEHGNKALLDTYTQTEANLADAVAKKHAHSNLEVLEGITAAKITEWDKVSGKAEQTALQGEIDRATAAEEALGARIDEFVECSNEDINSLFNA